MENTDVQNTISSSESNENSLEENTPDFKNTNSENVDVIEEFDIKEKKQIKKSKKEIDNTDVDIPSDHEEEEADLFKFEEEISQKSRLELIDILDSFIKDEDFNQNKSKIGLVKIAYNKLLRDENELLQKEFVDAGNKKEDFVLVHDSIHETFKNLFEKYKEKKAGHEIELEKDRQNNLNQKRQILEDLKLLVNSEETLKKTYDDFKSLQAKWRETGPVPPKEIADLWQSYNYFVEIFFDKIKINKELKDLDQKKNLERKIEICEKIEELLLEKSIKKGTLLIQQYHDEWREIGPVVNDKKDEIWERFKEATRKHNKYRQEYYDKINEEKEKNYQEKLAICEKVEALAEMNFNTIKEIEDRVNEISELQKTWKTIGFAPKKNNDEVWKRFKDANDLFFKNRHEFYQKIKGERINSLNLKLEICLNAESIKDSSDWKKTTEDFLKLQEDWKKIGSVPKKHSDKLWKRFREACDHFFNRKSEFFSNIDQHQENNLKLKTEIIQKVKDYQFGDNSEENLNIIKGFQREWLKVGHVPHSEKDNINKLFKETIDKCFDNLKMNSKEKSILNFKSRFDGIQSSSNGNRIVYQETTTLSTKINAMKSEIAVWENNIGFLSHSKSSELFRKEFEEKIATTKEKIKVMEEKLKYLKSLK